VTAVEVRGLSVRYGSLAAVDDLSFTAEAGAVTAVLGPNGAGKTSTIEVCEGYRRAAGGEVRVLGLDPTRQQRQLARRMGVMLQDGGVYSGIRVEEAVHLFCAFHDGGPTADALIDAVGLGDRRRSSWRQLSGGEQQRLSLALALAGDPDVAFLDEPTAGVDVAGRQAVRAVIRSLADRGCAVVLATHELDEAERLADHVVIIDHGRLVAAGTLDELREGHDEIRFRSTAGLDVVALGDHLAAAIMEVQAGEYVVAATSGAALIARLSGWLADHGEPLVDLRAGRQRLEDVFLRLTARQDEAS
jgi:ABC-2 type transport system ATP-binding protein